MKRRSNSIAGYTHDFIQSETGRKILKAVGDKIVQKVTTSTSTNTSKNSGGGSGFLTANYDASRIYKKKKPSKKKKAVRKFARKVNKVVRRPSSINFNDQGLRSKSSSTNSQECMGISMLGFNTDLVLPSDDIENNHGSRMLRMGYTDNAESAQAVPTGPDYMRSIYVETVSVDIYFIHLTGIGDAANMVIDFYECLCIRDVPTTWAPKTFNLFSSCFNVESVTAVNNANLSAYTHVPETPFTAKGWGRYCTVQKVDRILLPVGQTAHRSFIQKFGGKSINYQKVQDKVMLKGTKFYFWTWHGLPGPSLISETAFPSSRLQVSWTYNGKFHHFDKANTNNISVLG